MLGAGVVMLSILLLRFCLLFAIPSFERRGFQVGKFESESGAAELAIRMEFLSFITRIATFILVCPGSVLGLLLEWESIV